MCLKAVCGECEVGKEANVYLKMCLNESSYINLPVLRKRGSAPFRSQRPLSGGMVLVMEKTKKVPVCGGGGKINKHNG